MKIIPFFPKSTITKYSKNEKLLSVFTIIERILAPVHIKKSSQTIYSHDGLHTISHISCIILRLEIKLEVLKNMNLDLINTTIDVLDNKIKITCENFECHFSPDMILDIKNRFKMKIK